MVGLPTGDGAVVEKVLRKFFRQVEDFESSRGAASDEGGVADKGGKRANPAHFGHARLGHMPK